ncbi:hypothetical protein BGZ80_002884 [Entomortierella chlamydospora]|uniref:F-box domain protein n=1 Tax=Entomortierella chlamydospora TaxID=101097 RepID=A0A9P6MPJ8_9FUNG|nr:hypothetical protein BGZ79_005066 [Entomortierella chlamydospora]KAG0008947.1 hypothetical protein BGZ80_002884 [Entomortierella chlamydospora]
MRTLTLQGSYNLENNLRAILPYIPQLRQLNLQTHWTQSFERNTLVSLGAIFENAAQLKTLQLGDNISLSFSRNGPSPTNGSTTSLSPQLNESLACQNARGLVSLDVVDVKLNAQQLLGLSEYFPNLQTLKFDISPISISMDQYQNTKSVSAMKPPGYASNSQAFARDIAMSWPKLCDISIRYNEDRFKSGSIEAARLHTRDIVAELAPRLSSLDIWSELLHHELLDSLTRGECTLKKFVSIPRTHTNDAVPHDAFIHFLRNCSTLEIVDIGSALNLNLFDRNVSTQYLTPPTTPNLTPPSTPYFSFPPTSYPTMLWLQQPWACSNLKYVDLSLIYPQAAHKCYSQEEFRLCDNLYKQLARLTRLRVLCIKGTYYLPNDLKNSGFYQLASLKELRAISVCFFQDEDSLSDCKSQVPKDGRTTESSEDEVVGFLRRKDLEWMVGQWPSIKLLEFRGSFHNDVELKEAQHWVNETTGRSGKITLSDGRNSFIPSVRESLGLEY